MNLVLSGSVRMLLLAAKSLGEESFQAIQREVGQRRRDNPTLRCSRLRWVEAVFVHEPGLQPLPECHLIQRDVGGQPVVVYIVETAFDVAFQYPRRSCFLA